jgi:DNA repair protein SbcC/Rad50
LAGRVRLKSIEVEGFRGVNRRIHLDFGPKATVISAWNGKGKSTLLGSIEWALFGELRFQPPENRARDELVSIFHPGGRASVQLTVSVDGHDVRVSRTRFVGKMASDIEVKNEDGKTLEGEEASNYLFRLTGLSFDDFYRAAFLHQDSIRGLLTEEQKDRDEALDRLLGVDEIRNILTSIPMRPVTTALEEIEESERKLMQNLSGAGTVANDVRDRALAEAVGAGYEESNLTLVAGRKEAQTLLSDLSSACAKYGGEVPEVATVESPEDIEKVASRVKRTSRDIRISVGKESPLDAAVGRLGTLKKLRAEVEVAQRQVSDSRSEVENHEKENGKPAAWMKERSALEEAISRNERALHLLDIRGRVIADAIAYLDAVPAARECPVCGDPKEAAKLVTQLRTKVKKSQTIEIARLNEETAAANARLGVLSDLAKNRESLLATVVRCEIELKGALEEAWGALGKKGPFGDVIKSIADEYAATEARLDPLRNVNEAREGDLQRLDDSADRVRVLLRFLRADADLTRVREKAMAGEGGGSKALEEDKQELQSLRLELEAITKALNTLATGRAQEALAKCGDDISRIYGRLCNHPYFDGLKIEVGQKPVQGVQRNTYRIIAYSSKDGQRTAASSRLSTAQMNCVALSAYLSLTKILAHNLGFIMMDDPSQNLDSDHKKALANVIKELLPSEQLVIGTHDSEFDGFLRRDMGTSGVAWIDLEWTPRDGTVVKPYGSAAA